MQICNNNEIDITILMFTLLVSSKAFTSLTLICRRISERRRKKLLILLYDKKVCERQIQSTTKTLMSFAL